jgi:hypothetical protein
MFGEAAKTGVGCRSQVAGASRRSALPESVARGHMKEVKDRKERLGRIRTPHPDHNEQ